MKNRLIYPICAAILLVSNCTPKVEPIRFEVPEVLSCEKTHNLQRYCIYGEQ